MFCSKVVFWPSHSSCEWKHLGNTNELPLGSLCWRLRQESKLLSVCYLRPLRIIKGLGGEYWIITHVWTHSSARKFHKWLPINLSIKSKLLTMAKKCMHSFASLYLCNLPCSKQSNHSDSSSVPPVTCMFSYSGLLNIFFLLLRLFFLHSSSGFCLSSLIFISEATSSEMPSLNHLPKIGTPVFISLKTLFNIYIALT